MLPYTTRYMYKQLILVCSLDIWITYDMNPMRLRILLSASPINQEPCKILCPYEAWREILARYWLSHGVVKTVLPLAELKFVITKYFS